MCFVLRAVPLVPIASAAARQAFSARFTALVKAVQKKPAPPPIPGCDNPEVGFEVAWYDHFASRLNLGSIITLISCCCAVVLVSSCQASEPFLYWYKMYVVVFCALGVLSLQEGGYPTPRLNLGYTHEVVVLTYDPR